MTDHDFVCWLRGFSAALGTYSITPEHWETVRGQLAAVGAQPDVIWPPNRLSPGQAFSPIIGNVAR